MMVSKNSKNESDIWSLSTSSALIGLGTRDASVEDLGDGSGGKSMEKWDSWNIKLGRNKSWDHLLVILGAFR